MNSSSSRVNTLPAGLWGVFRRISLVRSENAAARASLGSAQSGGSMRTSFGVAPARRTIGR